MTQEEILQYNKRCAEFLGWRVVEFIQQYPNMFYLKSPKGLFYNLACGETEDDYWKNSFHVLKFHSDWNWIMEVLSKIEESHHTIISQGITGHYVNINREDVNILTQTLDNPSKFMGVGKTKQEAVVQAINQFLIWYNEDRKIP